MLKWSFRGQTSFLNFLETHASKLKIVVFKMVHIKMTLGLNRILYVKVNTVSLCWKNHFQFREWYNNVTFRHGIMSPVLSCKHHFRFKASFQAITLKYELEVKPYLIFKCTHSNPITFVLIFLSAEFREI